jgi:hypothetical protein
MVSTAKVLQVPSDETKVNRAGEEVPARFYRVGIRVDMEDGSHWFNSFRSDSWTHHWVPAIPEREDDWATEPVEHKQSYTRRELEREYRDRPVMLQALELGVALAWSELQG